MAAARRANLRPLSFDFDEDYTAALALENDESEALPFKNAKRAPRQGARGESCIDLTVDAATTLKAASN